MASAVAKGVVHGRTIVLDENAPAFPEGTEVVVVLRPAPGTPAAVLAAMDAEPHVTPEDVDALESAIAAGRRPPVSRSPFEDPQHPSQ
jgi:hypothetical protein